jgi:DNA-binding MarR family transcriptional regulator
LATQAPAAPEIATSLGVLDELIGYHLRRASAVLATDFARMLEGTDMRQVLFGILSVVRENPGINQGAVGRTLGIQRANMVAPVNDLAERGLIARQADKEDRRAFSLALTPKGEALFGDVLARIRAHEEAMLSDLSSGERATLIELLGRIEARGPSA